MIQQSYNVLGDNFSFWKKDFVNFAPWGYKNKKAHSEENAPFIKLFRITFFFL